MTRVTLRAGDDSVVVDAEAGGRIGSAVLGGRERLITAPPPDLPAVDAAMQWGAYVMAPWAGRVADAELRWDGEVHRLPARGEHALHGMCHDVAWAVEHATKDLVVLACDLGDAGWPLGGTVRHRVALESGRLRCRLTVTAGGRPMPVWSGWHPCFARSPAGATPGGATLRVGSAEVLVTDGMIPTGARAPAARELDLRSGPALGARRLDHTYVAPTGPATLTWPDLALDIGPDPTTHCLVVFTPPHEVCVEPQTAWPDALRLDQAGVPGTGLVRLAPGGSTTATMTWTWRASEES